MKKIEIKAAVLNKINQNLELKKIYHGGNLSKNQVLVKIAYTGICGSQIGRTSAAASAASTALPPLLRLSRATFDARGWEVATIPLLE